MKKIHHKNSSNSNDERMNGLLAGWLVESKKERKKGISKKLSNQGQIVETMFKKRTRILLIGKKIGTKSKIGKNNFGIQTDERS